MPKNLLMIFTRNPELGKVKSRLAADIGEEKALEIYKFLLQHSQKITSPLKVDKQVWYSEEIWDNDIWSNDQFSKHLQQGKDLGERMQFAFEKGFAAGYTNIIIIGSDLYDITSAEIEHAFQKLTENEAVIGPATDGGFYLLGLSVEEYAIFKNKEWGTSTVLKDSLESIKNLKSFQLSPKNDVDYLSDIEHIDVFQQFLK